MTREPILLCSWRAASVLTLVSLSAGNCVRASVGQLPRSQGPGTLCGDGTCEEGELCDTCARDCGQCPSPAAVCGDNDCVAGETCSDCPVDCGTCPAPNGPTCVWNHAYIEHGRGDSVSDILVGARNCYVLLDPFEENAGSIGGWIDRMQENGNLVGCYISSGTCEPWRDDMDPLPSFCGEHWPQWDEYYIDVSDEALAVMKARIDKLAYWGCQMVEFDNMDWNDDQEAIAYNNALCAHARGQSMGCMAKSTTRGSENFDGFTVESYPDNMDWWSSSDMQNMLENRGIGLIVHYDENDRGDCESVYEMYKNRYGSHLSFLCSDGSRYLHFNE